MKIECACSASKWRAAVRQLVNQLEIGGRQRCKNASGRNWGDVEFHADFAGHVTSRRYETVVLPNAEKCVRETANREMRCVAHPPRKLSLACSRASAVATLSPPLHVWIAIEEKSALSPQLRPVESRKCSFDQEKKDFLETLRKMTPARRVSVKIFPTDFRIIRASVGGIIKFWLNSCKTAKLHARSIPVNNTLFVLKSHNTRLLTSQLCVTNVSNVSKTFIAIIAVLLL